MDYIFDLKIKNEETIENLISSFLLSLELNFVEFKIEILNHVSSQLNEENIFQYILLSFDKKDDLGDFMVLILSKFYSNENNWTSEKINDITLFRYLFQRSKEPKILEFVVPKRLNFEKTLNDMVRESFNDSTHSDFIIKSKSIEFHVHKNILSNYIFFANLFNSNETNSYEMDTISSAIGVNHILHLFYNYSIEIPTNFNEIINIFDFLMMNGLETDSISILKKLEMFINIRNLSSLFKIYFDHKNTNNNEIKEYWEYFYELLLNYIKIEKNIDIYLELLLNVKNCNDDFINNLNKLIFENSSNDNFLRIINFYLTNDFDNEIIKKFENLMNDQNQKLIFQILISNKNLKNEVVTLKNQFIEYKINHDLEINDLKNKIHSLSDDNIDEPLRKKQKF
jgi:hypothetical protein